jgi:hypothetical protein
MNIFSLLFIRCGFSLTHLPEIFFCFLFGLLLQLPAYHTHQLLYGINGLPPG